MAAYAAVVSLMNNIDQIMKHPHLFTSLDKKQIQPLVDKAGFLLDFIEGYYYGGGSKEAEDVQRQIASAAHAAEDVIESHIVDRILGGSTAASRLTFSYLFYSLTSKKSLDLQKIVQDMDAVMEKATELKQKRGSREEQPKHSRALMETRESGMVGLDEELIQLLDDLTGHQSSRHIISIVGMGGMGKTTLAKNVYENLLIQEHFQFRAWATVSEQYDAEKILSQLVSSLGKSTSGSVDSLGEQLHKTLSGRRYLIILDDIWSVGAWDKVRRFFPDNGNGSRIVLTTRLSNVAKDCGSSSITNMKLLDEDKSWKLFCEKAFPHEDCPSEIHDVGKEIVRLCKGLALSIVVIGGLLLKSPRSVGYWKDVAEDIKSIPNSKEKQESLDVLSLSYSHLPPHIKPCFLYMGVFEESSEIRVSKIIKLWVAEGFLKPNGAQDLEEIAAGYLKELIDRNLILIGRHRHNGEIGSCGIHDLLRDLCLKIAQQEEIFHVIDYHDDEIIGTERRLICGRVNESSGPSLSLARSIFMVTCYPLEQPVTYRLLRVLDQLSALNSTAELYGNVNLRYLAYSLPHRFDKQPLLWELPSSVSLIWNLQTLIIKEYLSSPMVVAPIEIWKMGQLRHVECHRIYLPGPPRDGLLIWENFLTLKTAVNFKLSEEVCKIIPNIKKLHLLYHCDLLGYDDCLIECLCNLDCLHKLESLNLSITGRRWPFPDSEANKKLRFPSCLNKLSLSNCGLHWDDLKIIGSLPQLQVLHLEFYSVMDGVQWSPIDGQFLRLKILKIDHCELLCWDAGSSHFPVLEKLYLRRLDDLKEIPVDIGEIPTLKLIRVDRCSDSAAISAVKIKEEQLESQDNHGLQIQVKIYISDLESFNKRLETERLTINNIQFEIHKF